MIYFLLFFFEAFTCYIFDNIKFDEKKAISTSNLKVKIVPLKLFLVLAIIVPMWLIMGLRYNIGTDFQNYIEIFKLATVYHQNKYNMEIGYYGLNRLIGLITNNSQILFLIVAIIIIFFFVKAMIENGEKIYYGVLCFLGMGYYFYAMNGQRQYIAVAIMFYAFKFLEKRELKKYLVCVFISICFHKSALIWIPLYFILNYVNSKVFYLVSFIMALAVNLTGQRILTFLANIGFYTKQITINIAILFTSHFSILNVIISGVFFIISIVFYTRLVEKRPINSQRIKLLWLLVLMYTLLYKLGASISRIATYLCPVYFLILSDILECFNPKIRWIARIGITVVLVILMYVLLTYSGNDSQNFLPYVSRWSEN